MDPDGLTILLVALAAGLVCFVVGWVLAKKLTLPAWLDRLLAPAGLGGKERVTEEEFLEIMDDADEEEIDESQKRMINNIFDLDDVCAGDIMTHRTEVTAVELTASCRQAVAAALESGNSRLPVYKGSLDDVAGMLYVKDLLRLVDHPEELYSPVQSFVRQAMFVPESRPARELLLDFKRKKCLIAIVVDEYGGTAGIVTMEDILEEIVGNIQDEYDNEEEPLTRNEDGSVSVDAALDLEDLFDALDLPLPERSEDEEFDTVGGLVADRLGHIPAEGEAARVEWGGVEFTVQRVASRRVVRVLARCAEAAAAAKGED
ncbi:HlyC/CorC family transporter [Gemmiger formicilis]|uniref:hemolysin family protein n=1 Tax=Gemmiger formicilis TaxID=745368 RepID=UPI00195B65CB|nr:hemolysin family protein [Gemmiger formicilis]MBM6916644.1 HlyC/CorC family transporter [Gemmiger formicilis]